MVSAARLTLFACFVVFALLLFSSHASARELSENTVDASNPNEAAIGDAKWWPPYHHWPPYPPFHHWPTYPPFHHWPTYPPYPHWPTYPRYPWGGWGQGGGGGWH